MGKELANFVSRISRLESKIRNVQLQGKMNGAVGNFNAHRFVLPNVDWPSISQGFIENELGLEYNAFSTQIECHDSLCELFGFVSLMNSVLLGLSRDIWQYISYGYFKLKVNPGETGSSIMPHKVNPIDFENAEGNLGISNSLLEHFRTKLPISR
jgi:adenylosuccinate lyase